MLALHRKRFFLFSFFSILLILYLYNHFGLSRVIGNGMHPALSNGDLAIYKKNPSNVDTSDIVIYTQNLNTNVGRIIAVPGEAIRVENGNVYIDKRNSHKYRLIENYLSSSAKTYSSFKGWKNIGPEKYIVLKDNKRDNVDLSEYLIDQKNIVGVIIKTF